jgi:hypothetical protein
MPTRRQTAKLRETGAKDTHMVALLRPLTQGVEKMFADDLLEGTRLSQASGSARAREEEALKRKIREWRTESRTKGAISRKERAHEKGRQSTTAYGTAFDSIGRVVPVQGDGNCLFRAVAVTEGESEEMHAQWRAKLVALYTQHLEEFQAQDSSITLRLNDLARDRTWAHEFDVQVMAEVLGKKIRVWPFRDGTRGESYEHDPVRQRFPGVTRMNIFKDDCHFDALLPDAIWRLFTFGKDSQMEAIGQKFGRN